MEMCYQHLVSGGQNKVHGSTPPPTHTHQDIIQPQTSTVPLLRNPWTKPLCWLRGCEPWFKPS